MTVVPAAKATDTTIFIIVLSTLFVLIKTLLCEMYVLSKFVGEFRFTENKYFVTITYVKGDALAVCIFLLTHGKLLCLLFLCFKSLPRNSYLWYFLGRHTISIDNFHNFRKTYPHFRHNTNPYI